MWGQLLFVQWVSHKLLYETRFFERYISNPGNCIIRFDHELLQEHLRRQWNQRTDEHQEPKKQQINTEKGLENLMNLSQHKVQIYTITSWSVNNVMTKERADWPKSQVSRSCDNGQKTVLQRKLPPSPLRTTNESWVVGRRDHCLLLSDYLCSHPQRSLPKILPFKSEN